MILPKAKTNKNGVVKYACGHRMKRNLLTHANKPCPKCRAAIHKERADRYRDLPYYLRIDG